MNKKYSLQFTIQDQESEEEPCSLTISDWVTFLASEKHGTMSTAMGYAAVLVALISIVLITKTDNVFQILGSGLFALAAVTYANKSIFSRLEKRSKKANRILKEIMSGDLKTEKVIRKKWQKEEE